MASLVSTVVDSYNDLMDNRSDPRVKDWFMMSSPFPTVAICLSYAFFVKNLGPKLMANRKPFGLRNTMLVYNLLQVIISIYLFYEGMVSGWGGKYSFRCQPVDYSNDPLALRMAAGCWFYYISKFIELTDTIFFVLRKKNDHITTLHVIHHGIMPLSVWFGVKFTPGGHSSFFGLLNAFVHIWMYLYYFLAALGPAIQPYLWWKKYLTTLQMTQFVIVMIHELQLLFIECNYPKAFVWWIGLHACLFFFLFRDFYNQAYTKKQQSKAKKEAEYDLMAAVEPDREGIKQSDLWAGNFDHIARKRRENGAATRDLMAPVEPDREGIKQSDLWAGKYEQVAKKRRENGVPKNDVSAASKKCELNGVDKRQAPIYANDYKIATGYISDEGLRSRVFLDKNGTVEK